MEIVVRAVVLFGFLWLITRVVGRSTLGELSTFQLLLFVTMGDLVQQSITQQDYSLTSGVLAVGVFALLTIPAVLGELTLARRPADDSRDPSRDHEGRRPVARGAAAGASVGQRRVRRGA
jgi:hypothetical protein